MEKGGRVKKYMYSSELTLLDYMGFRLTKLLNYY